MAGLRDSVTDKRFTQLTGGHNVLSSMAKSEDIKVWRRNDLGGVEFRTGTAVSEPYPKHWHDEYQVCLITDGGGEVNYRGVRYDTPAESLFILHPGEIHSNYTSTGCSFRSVYIEPKLVSAAILNEGSDKGLPFFANPIVFDREVISAFIAMHQEVSRSVSKMENEGSLLDFLGLLAKRSEIRGEPARNGNEPAAIRIARDYITEHHERNISLRELGILTALSPFHLARVFSRTVGMPPHAFQTSVRISAGKEWIRRGRTVAEAAVLVGFADQSHFHRHFLRLMKVTPGEYLKNSKNVQS